MRLKKEVDIILIALFVVLFFGLGAYIGIKQQNGERVVDLKINSVWSAAKNAQDIVPEPVTYQQKESSEQIKEPFEESPGIVVPEEVNSNIIEIKDTKFYPDELTVKVGTSVTWSNKDPKHNYQVYERSEKQMFNSLQLTFGKEFSYTFNETGTYYFSDAIFKYMKGKIVVTNQ